jgi:sugar/nucleoside kinase (ribokinase family)
VLCQPYLISVKTCVAKLLERAILALNYLGFRVAPICRLQDDKAAKIILSEFKRWGVDTRFVSIGPDGSTPIIFQKIRANQGGTPTHTFSWRCPACGKRLPSYKPVLATTAEMISTDIQSPNVFFFDRVNRGSLLLAERASHLGALVVFEPSGVGDPGSFKEAWSLAHVVKYSHERLTDIPDTLEFGPNQLLQIETLGAEGLRYRMRSRKKLWKMLEVFNAPRVADTAGAGDWCTAGLIHQLGRDGSKGFSASSQHEVESALRFGQALAAWNCGFKGARGGMKHHSKYQCLEIVERMLAGRSLGDIKHAEVHELPSSSEWCPTCGDEKEIEMHEKTTSRRFTA